MLSEAALFRLPAWHFAVLILSPYHHRMPILLNRSLLATAEIGRYSVKGRPAGTLRRIVRSLREALLEEMHSA
jgi:hypothetical protein